MAVEGLTGIARSIINIIIITPTLGLRIRISSAKRGTFRDLSIEVLSKCGQLSGCIQ